MNYELIVFFLGDDMHTYTRIFYKESQHMDVRYHPIYSRYKLYDSRVP